MPCQFLTRPGQRAGPLRLFLFRRPQFFLLLMRKSMYYNCNTLHYNFPSFIRFLTHHGPPALPAKKIQTILYRGIRVLKKTCKLQDNKSKVCRPQNDQPGTPPGKHPQTHAPPKWPGARSEHKWPAARVAREARVEKLARNGWGENARSPTKPEA